MARWMDKLNKSGCAPGVSELSGFAQSKELFLEIIET